MSSPLSVRYSSMNAGKSTALLQLAHNYAEMNKRVLLFTAAIDDRSGKGIIASRLGIKRAAMTFDRETNFRDLINRHENIAAVLIDEAQFLQPDQCKQVHKVAALDGIPVICFCLRTDFQGEPFQGSACLLSLAEEISEVKAVCACEEYSTMNIRIDHQGSRIRDGEQVLIGGNGQYKQVCSRCFYL